MHIRVYRVDKVGLGNGLTTNNLEIEGEIVFFSVSVKATKSISALTFEAGRPTHFLQEKHQLGNKIYLSESPSLYNQQETISVDVAEVSLNISMLEFIHYPLLELEGNIYI